MESIFALYKRAGGRGRTIYTSQKSTALTRFQIDCFVIANHFNINHFTFKMFFLFVNDYIIFSSF